MTGQTKTEWAVEVLTSVQKEFPDAFIAGGFFRDIELDMPPNDLDIFIGQEGDDQQDKYKKFHSRMRKVNKHLRDAGLIGTNNAHMAPFYDQLFVEDERPLVGVAMYKCDTQDDQPKPQLTHPIQVIAMSADGFSLDKIIEDFDIGICQIAHDGKVLRKTARFDDDVALKRLVITRSRSFPCFRRTVARLEKMLERIPPEHNGGSFEDEPFLTCDTDKKTAPNGWSVWTEVNVVTGKKLPQPQEWRMKND